jgi:thiamine biosynthesis protein ThiI
VSNRLILVKYGEMALKGLNRRVFERLLIENIKISLNGMRFTIRDNHGRIYVQDLEDDKIEEYLEKLSKVFGIVWLTDAYIVPSEMDDIVITSDMLAKMCISEGKTRFKVETRRTNKGFFLNSPQMSSELGSRLLDLNPELIVNVNSPDFILNVEIRDKTYIYTRSIKGQGGMPYKSAGKGVLLLSGGIDSPVAGYMMAKRGMEIVGVHFHSYPFTSDRAYDKVKSLAKELSSYVGRINLYSVNILNIQTAINDNCNPDFSTILQRRFMTKIASLIAKQENAKALITGESLGQVASQTLEGINATNDAALFPVFRPLIAFDKVDIIKIARYINTYETSILPYEDCCTVFLPSRVATKPNISSVLKNEALLDVDILIEEALGNLKVELIK